MAKHKGRGISSIEYPTGMNQNGDPSQASANGATASQANGQELADDNAIASSKRKKKKGLHKVIPFK